MAHGTTLQVQALLGVLVLVLHFCLLCQELNSVPRLIAGKEIPW